MRQKLWKVIRKTYVVEFPCKKLPQLQEYSLQPTIGIKIALQIHSGSAQKGNNVLNFVNYKKSLQNCRFFSNATALQSRISEYQKKKFFFQGMLEKLLLKKVLKIIRKMSLVAFLLKNSNCPIPPPITMRKLTPPQIFPLLVSRILKLVCGGIIFK